MELIAQDNVLLQHCPGLLRPADEERPAPLLRPGPGTVAERTALLQGLGTVNVPAPSPNAACSPTRALAPASLAAPAGADASAECEPSGGGSNALAVLAALVLALYLLYMCACMPSKVRAGIPCAALSHSLRP